MLHRLFKPASRYTQGFRASNTQCVRNFSTVRVGDSKQDNTDQNDDANAAGMLGAGLLIGYYAYLGYLKKEEHKTRITRAEKPPIEQPVNKP